MTEFEKWKSGESFDSSKLWVDMEDSSVDSLLEGLREGDAPGTGNSKISGAPFNHNKSVFNYFSKALKKAGAKKGSFFARCDHDPDTGGCLPEGEYEAKKPKPKKDKPKAKADPSGKPKQTPVEDETGPTTRKQEIVPLVSKTSKRSPNSKAKSLAESPVIKVDSLSGGRNITMLYTLESGQRGVFKPAVGEKLSRDGIRRGTFYRREVASYRYAEILGFTDMVPITEFRSQAGNDGSIQEYEPNAKTAIKMGEWYQYDGKENAARAALYDYLIGATDRNKANWLVKENGDLVLIDNGLSFSYDYGNGDDFVKWGRIFFWEHADKLNLPMPDLSSIKGKWDELETSLLECGLEKEAIALAKTRYETVVSGKYKRIKDLPAPDGLGGLSTISDMIELKNQLEMQELREVQEELRGFR